MRIFRGLLLLASVICAADAAHAEELVVGVKVAPPFVIQADDAEPQGFSVDLAREIARRLDPPRTVRFVVHDDLETHLDAVASGRVQMGIAATSITSDRERRLDFSNPFFRDALDIAVHEDAGEYSLLRAVWASDVPKVLLGLLLFVLASAHIVWLAERGRGGLDSRYLPGVGQGVWWSVVTMSTVGYGDIVPKTSVGRVLAVVVIFAGIIVFGVAVASLTAAATAQKFEGPVQGVADLRGKRVVAVPGSIAERDLRRRGIDADPASDTRSGLDAVLSGEADAFVHDRSQLLHAHEAGGGIVLIGRPFVQQSYAAVFQLGSSLRKPVNIALQRVSEGDDAIYDVLYERWFESE